MKSRKLVIGLLIMFAFVVSSFTFAYWSSVSLEDSVASNSVTIGEGRQATVTATVGTTGTGTLVPSGEAANSVSTNPVESLEYTFTVDWADNGFTGQEGALAVVVDNVSNTTAATYLSFSDDATVITEGVTTTVTITVTLTAPANETDYNAIINDAVTFDVNFTVTP